MTRLLRGSIAAALLLPACAGLRPGGGPAVEAGVPVLAGTLGENAVTASAVVRKIDLEEREVTLERADGKLVTIKAGPEVRNLAQLRVGDQVRATYYESIAYEVRKPGEGAPGMAVTEGAQRAPLGGKPGAAAARITTITATISAIDKAKGTVSLLAPDGEVVTVKARDPRNLEKVKPGDLVEITMSEAMAISVEGVK
jgi:Cu/Ag efflux protein CusF